MYLHYSCVCVSVCDSLLNIYVMYVLICHSIYWLRWVIWSAYKQIIMKWISYLISHVPTLEYVYFGTKKKIDFSLSLLPLPHVQLNKVYLNTITLLSLLSHTQSKIFFFRFFTTSVVSLSLSLDFHLINLITTFK